MRTAIAFAAGLAVAAAAYLVIFKSPHYDRLAAGARETALAEDDGCAPQVTTVSAKQRDAARAEEEPIRIGRFPGTVSYDEDTKTYYLQLRGARLPFKANPIEALEVKLEAPGKTAKERNQKLLYGLLGPQVRRWTLLTNPDEKREAEDAAVDLVRYLRMVSRTKFGGVAYTKRFTPAKAEPQKPQVKRLDDATDKDPIILLKGPKAGASSTRVKVLGKGKFLVEGKTYADLTKAADLVGMTAIKMLCGSSDCPDAAACATGGKCGCG